MNRDDQAEAAYIEELYKAYKADRNDDIPHAQIVSEGLYAKHIDDFGLRYSLEQSAYVDALDRTAAMSGAFGFSPCLRSHKDGQ